MRLVVPERLALHAEMNDSTVGRSPHYLRAVVTLTIALLLTAVAVACDPTVDVTYVNHTDGTAFVEINNGREKPIKPHAKITVSTLDRSEDPYVVTIRDEEGNVLYHEETTVGEVKKRNQPIVIGGPVPSPTPPD